MNPDPAGTPQHRRTGPLRSLGFWFAASVALIAAGVAALLWLGHGRGAALLGATQGLCLLLAAFVARAVRSILRAEPAWRLLLSWVLSVAFVVGVIALYEAGRPRWAEILMGVVALGSLLGTAILYYFPQAANPDQNDPRSD